MKITIVVGLTLWIEYCMTENENELAILKQMQGWGYSKFSTIKGENTSQYLVAVVVQNDSNPKNFVKYLDNGCQANLKERLVECRKSAVILNRHSEEIWLRSKWNNNPKHKGHAWHGEYRLLHDGIAERLTANVLADNPKDQCKIYLYSFYIPCCNIPNVPYSCASLISDYNNAQKTKCKITLVGYSQVYKKTKFKEAEKCLTGAHVDCFQFHEQSFQELMFQCMSVSKLSECCVDDQKSGVNSIRILSYFVNAMMFRLKQNQKIANSNYDQAMKLIMLEEIKKWLSVNIRGDCYKCWKNPKDPQDLIYVCAQRALDQSPYLGTPENRNDLSTAKWNPLKGKISNIYMIDPKNFINTMKLMCAFRFLTIDSLCTGKPP